MTQELKHTPGPWAVSEAGKTSDGMIRVASEVVDRNVCGVFVSEFDVAEDEANARLIASSPDLMAALEEIAEGKGAYSRDPLVHATNVIEAMKGIARAAIAKAKGGAS